MPKERTPPYVSAGFRDDAEKLLYGFAKKKSLKFMDFAVMWREMKFSLVFMGKENLKELIEFTLECYRNVLLFMGNSDPFMKVATVYLLYGMYSKQPLNLLKRPIQIPVSIKQVHEVHQLEKHFMDKNVEDALNFSYLITQLFKMEAFCVTCFPIPMGPVVPSALFKLAPLRSSCFKEALGSVRLLNEGEIKNIEKLMKKYEGLKKSLPCVVKASQTTAGLNRFSELKEAIAELEERYNAGLPPNKINHHTNQEDEFRRVGKRRPLFRTKQAENASGRNYLGHRRAFLKAQQFGKAAGVGLSRRARQSSDSSPEKSAVEVKKARGRPKIKRTRGRKKRYEVLGKQDGIVICVESDEDIDAEMVDDPGNSTISRAQPKKTKKPRPVRKHYFEDE